MVLQKMTYALVLVIKLLNGGITQRIDTNTTYIYQL